MTVTLAPAPGATGADGHPFARHLWSALLAPMGCLQLAVLGGPNPNPNSCAQQLERALTCQAKPRWLQHLSVWTQHVLAPRACPQVLSALRTGQHPPAPVPAQPGAAPASTCPPAGTWKSCWERGIFYLPSVQTPFSFN